MQNGASNRPHHKSLVDALNSVSPTTVVAHTKSTEKKEEEVHNKIDKFPFGAIDGEGLSAVVVNALILVLVICKIRSCGIFKAPKIQQNNVFFSKAINDDSNITADINSVITSKHTYGTARPIQSNCNTYATGNKNKAPDLSLSISDDIYTDSSYGNYDQLNEVQKRNIRPTGNLYDSNRGIRNENDP
ncbi:unnamed protein product [Mytilus coruscus]|uniref:Uncharacterized protein n=1 Tax=Mytilus coruscus TaxID=42192 RepID=A0A6J8ERZ3_MYTCO|nr:unnamed protein product [Mytilus coruscus]